jgi:hypothetical protein
MVKRSNRLKRAVESYKEEIERHFDKLDNDLMKNNEILARYHIKEISLSLIATLEKKFILLENNKENAELIEKYKQRLEEYKKKLGIEES